ncbi:hypothetical protein VTK26DRAFT_4619 [Humicola hyalothermophila]
MAPAANTARPRRVSGAAALTGDSDSDLDFQAYSRRLSEASAARIRLRKAQDNRDAHRAAVKAAYTDALDTIESRIRAAVVKHKTVRSAISLSYLHRLRAALQHRDAKLSLIARKLGEHRRRMLNLAVQLQALYEGRKEELEGKLETLGEEEEEKENHLKRWASANEVAVEESQGNRKVLEKGGNGTEREVVVEEVKGVVVEGGGRGGPQRRGGKRVDEALAERVMGRGRRE